MQQTAVLSGVLFLLSLADARTPLFIGALFPMTSLLNDSWTGGRGILPAARIALGHVNKANVLRNYELMLVWNDTRGFSGWAEQALFEFIHFPPHKIMLLGAGFSSCSAAVAAVGGLDTWRIPQISYASTSPELSDKKFYPYFYRTIPDDSSFNAPRLAILENFQWTRVATIFQEEDIHRAAMSDLRSKFIEQKITQVTSESFRDDAGLQIRHIKDRGARIILGNFFGKGARKVFCAAYQLKLFGPKFVWILLGYIEREWWATRDSSVDCTAAQMLEAADGHLATDYQYEAEHQTRTVSGRTVGDFFAEYHRSVEPETRDQHGSYAYDAIWAMALALNQSIYRLPPATQLDQLAYGNEAVMEVISESLIETKFTGITGPVGFTINGDRIGDTRIVQMRGGVYEQVGLYHVAENRINWTGYANIFWKGGSPPRDQSIFEYKLISVSLPIFITMVTASFLCMGVSVFFLWFNVTHRTIRSIKMSSPNLNNAIIVGSLLSYLSIIPFGLDGNLISTGHSVVCESRAWTLSLAFSLAYGAMFSKTWRVHLIFMNKKLKRKVIKDRHLLGVVLLLVIIDVIYLITWQILDPQQRIIQEFPEEEDTSTDVKIIKQVEHCESQETYRWLGILGAYKGLLLVFGAFLAWETRNVSIPALNDSRYIGLSVYNMLILCIIGAPMSLLLRDQPNACYCVVCACVLASTSITLGLVFIPKVRVLKRNLSVEVQISRTFTSRNWAPTGSSLGTIDSAIQERSEEYRRKLDEKDEEIRELQRRIQAAESRPPAEEGTPKISDHRQLAEVKTREKRRKNPGAKNRRTTKISVVEIQEPDTDRKPPEQSPNVNSRRVDSALVARRSSDRHTIKSRKDSDAEAIVQACSSVLP